MQMVQFVDLRSVSVAKKEATCALTFACFSRYYSFPCEWVFSYLYESACSYNDICALLVTITELFGLLVTDVSCRPSRL
ncbi:hypothetical protein KSX_36840 [Ktedonospora formicarum]|uniref:Uncharacterized protein n=1 Tax=Ktedonospora formicarum TaxID=2778364 RepID=A0A8J3MT50_9CHLR|nr:hypothetical protein KSX_36840 [Ktedonospora formicarum]